VRYFSFLLMPSDLGKASTAADRRRLQGVSCHRIEVEKA